MNQVEQEAQARKFAEYWKARGYEKGESQPFWIGLLRDVFGVENPEQGFISFEDQVHLDHTSFIDGRILSTKVLIEQKSSGKDLRAPIRQSDGSFLRPFEQAKRYITELPVSQHPRWVVTCNFQEFNVYDMERPGGDPEVILLEDLEKEFYRLDFLVNEGDNNLKREMEISIAAGDIVGLLYDAFLKEYKNPESKETQKSLNKLCVRLVFCFYAEDAGIFGSHSMFHDYLAQYDAKHTRTALMELFRVLDQKPEERDPYLNSDLAAFPYVNGGLFADEDIEIPYITEDIRDLILNKASSDFNWSEISPTIFGAVFESTLNPETRRSGGMHYTSVENIHKVIDPLFLDDLKKEYYKIMDNKTIKSRLKELRAFQNKLASLTFLDPACGSGNFLTETYLALRTIENGIIEELTNLEKNTVEGQITFLFNENKEDIIKVSIGQFYGIEINDFAVSVAQTALWIAESQMMHKTELILHGELDFLPLKSLPSIREGNALRIDWNDVIPADKLTYIMGNPPFSGTRTMSKTQKNELLDVFGKNWNSAASIDYVGGWYKIAAEFIQHTTIKCAFVSTNSVVQGEQVSALWKPLFSTYKIIINFAYQTFIWDSEATIKAHVHCVIVGFSLARSNKTVLFQNGRAKLVENINAYLNDAPDVFIERQNKPLCDVPEMYLGCTFNDNNNLVLTKEEMTAFIEQYPESEKLIRPYIMGKDFISRKYRYCFWLVNTSPAEIRKYPELLERINRVQEFRRTCKNDNTLATADTPSVPSMLRFYTHENGSDYVAIPKVSSQRRRYIPIELVPGNVVAGDKIFLMPEADIYTFGVLTSNVHMAWTRAFCGRLKSDYSYSSTIVYNTFPWPTPSVTQIERIKQTAQLILDARAKYPDSSLADLYDPLTMPSELITAHQKNDIAVMAAYGWKKGDPAFESEASCISELMKLYKKLIEQQK